MLVSTKHQHESVSVLSCLFILIFSAPSKRAAMVLKRSLSMVTWLLHRAPMTPGAFPAFPYTRRGNSLRNSHSLPACLFPLAQAPDHVWALADHHPSVRPSSPYCDAHHLPDGFPQNREVASAGAGAHIPQGGREVPLHSPESQAPGDPLGSPKPWPKL